MSFPELVETERLLLQRWRASDEQEVMAIWASGDVFERLRPGTAYDAGLVRLGFERHLEHWERYGFGIWTLRDRADARLLGWAGASHPGAVPELANEVEIGWTLHPDARGHGYAGEAAAAACEAAFAQLGVARVISLIQRSNAPSRAVALRLGMRLDRQVLYPQLGEELDVYALRAAD